MLKDKIRAALQRAYKEAGTQQLLEKKSGVTHAQISRLLSGKNSCGQMRIDTLEKLFPDLVITFFRDEQSQKQTSKPNPVQSHILDIVDSLSFEKQIECLTFIAAKYGKIDEATKPETPPQTREEAG